jgi:acyl carrier protein
VQDYRLEEICEQVKEVILDSLDIEAGEYTLATNLVNDLEAESLDFLDIVFRLEKRFGIKIERGSIEKTLRARFPGLNIKPNTPVTDDMRAALRELLPEVPAEEIAELTKMKDVARTFRIATFVRLTVQAMQQQGTAAIAAPAVRDGYSPQQLGIA